MTSDYRRDLAACAKLARPGLLTLKQVEPFGTNVQWFAHVSYGTPFCGAAGRTPGEALRKLLRELKKRDGRKG